MELFQFPFLRCAQRMLLPSSLSRNNLTCDNSPSSPCFDNCLTLRVIFIFFIFFWSHMDCFFVQTNLKKDSENSCSRCQVLFSFWCASKNFIKPQNLKYFCEAVIDEHSPVAAQGKWAESAGGAAKSGTLDTLFFFSCLEIFISVSVLRFHLSEQTPLTTDQN